MIRNIIFDWSGTLVDDLPAVWQASNYVFVQAGVPEMTLDEFRREFFLPFKSFYDRYTPDVPMDQLQAWYQVHFKTVIDTVEALPHAREFLHFCRSHRIRTFLLSTVHPEHFEVQSRAVGFDVLLDRPYVEVWDKREKIVELLAENQLLAEETMFIGDMQHDIETAKHGGVFSCAVLTGYNRLHQLRESNPDLIVEHLGELRAILEQGKFELKHGAAEVSPVMHPISTVGALIFDAQNRVLMIRTEKWSGLWGIPGGKIKYGEPSLDSLSREIEEETGLHVRNIRFVMVQDCIHSKEFYREAHFLLLNYTCEVAGETAVTLNEEAQEFQWVSLAQASEMSLNTPTRLLIEHVLQTMEEKSRRGAAGASSPAVE